MQATDFYIFSSHLHQSDIEPVEAKYRTAIGRAYYSAYHQVTSWLDLYYDDFEITKGGMHTKTAKYFRKLHRETRDRRYWQLYLKYSQFVSLRVLADYEIKSVCSSQEVELAIVYYNEIMNLLTLIDSENSFNQSSE